MNKKERQAVLKMLLIREELTDKEFVNAIDFIRRELIDGNSSESVLQKNFSAKKKSRDTTPELLSELKKEQPEKHRLLTELYKYVQDATVFKTVADARQFGRMIGLKDTGVQAKQEVITNIFKVLSEMSNELIVEQLTKVDQFTEKSDEPYQKLSKFIMNSKQT
ncbi:hypothetical protein KW467_20430 [Vibrio fluvialis]|nr:hypothetical protein [Vibrio fluvialis]